MFNKIKFRKSISIELALLMTALIAGCSSNSSSTSSNNTGGGAKSDLSVLIYAQEHEKKVYQDLVSKFKEEHSDDIRNVNFEVTTQDQYQTKMTASFTSNDLPDIFYVGPDGLKNYVNNGYIKALDEMIESNENIDISNIWPQIINAYRYDGKKTGEGSLYALPKDLSTFAYAYNKDIFDEAGVPYPDPEKPYTWDEFVEVCKQLTKDIDGDGKTDQWGAGFANAFMFTPFVYGNNGRFLNDDFTQVVINEDENFKEAFQFYRDLTLEHKITPTVEQDAALGFYQRWLAGQLGFYACGTWDVSAFMDKNTVPFNWDLCAWPVGKSGKSTTWNGTVGFAVSSNSKVPELALDLISYLSVNLDGQKQLCGEEGGQSLQIPNIMDYAKTTFREKVNDGTIPYPKNVDVIFNYIEGTDKYQGIFPESTYTYNAEWLNLFYEGMPNVMNGTKTVDDYCAELQPKMQKALEKAIELENSNTK